LHSVERPVRLPDGLRRLGHRVEIVEEGRDRPESAWSMIARARLVAATMSSERMRCLTRGMLCGAIDNSRSPSLRLAMARQAC
jgi:hypothetical protein